jgi:hypothetical protein
MIKKLLEKQQQAEGSIAETKNVFHHLQNTNSSDVVATTKGTLSWLMLVGRIVVIRSL